MNYYVDTCIYVNLFNKEVAENGFSYWEIARKFFDKISRDGDLIYYSGYLLKELSYVLGDELFIENISTFLHSGNFIKAKLTNQEYIESKWIHKVNKNIGFFDVTHMLLAKKTKTILVTRDKELLELCKKYNVQTKTPEEVLSFR